MKRLFIAALLGTAQIGIPTGAAEAQAVERTQDAARELLTREGAVARALGDDPGVAAAAESVRAANAEARQAGLRPNPTLDVQLEDFAGSGPASGVTGAEATYALTQQFELGGDRRARRMAGERQADAARLRAGLSELDLREAVEIAFVESQAAAAFADVARARVGVAREFADAVDRRVRAARDPVAARARVAARLAETEIELQTALARSSAAKTSLASYWAGTGDISVETASFFTPIMRGRGSAIAVSPDIALVEAEREGAAARVEIERARRVPDPSVRAGFRQLRAIDESAFVVGVSVPLPIWNRNSGAIAAARANERRAELEVVARERELVREIAYLVSQADAARAEITAYAERIIPSSEQALVQSLDAYRRGGLSYLEVLDAQGSLAEARERQIAALLSYHRAEAKLARRRGVSPSDSFQENSQ